MGPERFSTLELPQQQQIDAWRGWFDTVFDLSVDDTLQGFAAQSTTWMLDGFALSRVSAPRLKAMRTRALIRRNPVDHWVITLGKRRTLGIAGRIQTLDVPEGTPFVVSLGNELVSVRNEDERLQLYLPRDAFSELAPVLDAAQGQPLATPLGKLLGEYILLLEQNLAGLSQADLPRLRNAVRAMVLACIAPSADALAIGSSQIEATRREKIRQIIGKNLRNPALGPDMLCREVGMSRTQLYLLLQNEGGIARYIQRRRLLQSYAELSDPTNAKSVTLIADSLCFQDLSSFSRAFKQEFGMTPRDVRSAAATGLPLVPAPKDRSGSGIVTLSDLLSQF